MVTYVVELCKNMTQFTFDNNSVKYYNETAVQNYLYFLVRFESIYYKIFLYSNIVVKCTVMKS